MGFSGKWWHSFLHPTDAFLNPAAFSVGPTQGIISWDAACPSGFFYTSVILCQEHLTLVLWCLRFPQAAPKPHFWCIFCLLMIFISFCSPAVVLSPLLFQPRPALDEALTSLSQSNVCSWALGKPWQMQKHLEICSAARFAVTMKGRPPKAASSNTCGQNLSQSFVWPWGRCTAWHAQCAGAEWCHGEGRTGFVTSVLPWVEIRSGASHIWRNHLQKLLEGLGSLMLILDYLRQWFYPWERETWFFLSWSWSLQPHLNYKRERGWNKYKHWHKRCVSLV